jgi:diguanylate cyclase (GGDEF)-like protein
MYLRVQLVVVYQPILFSNWMAVMDGFAPFNEKESILAKLSQQLVKLEKRDFELWVIVAFSGVAASCGLLALIFPSAFLQKDNFHFEITVNKETFIGLVATLVLLQTYVAFRRFELRRLREKVISTSIQGELVRLQSFTDPLTEVYNRRSLDEMAGRFIAHARRRVKPLSFVLADVDRFKEVNTRFGHLTGDLVLAEVASLLRGAVRGCDAVVRYGGDEFILILADAERPGAERVVERIQTALRDWNHEGHLEDFKVTVSLGIAEWKDGMTLDEALDEADRNMYQEKEKRDSYRGAKSEVQR